MMAKINKRREKIRRMKKMKGKMGKVNVDRKKLIISYDT